jgi:hypothetical protein
MVVPVFADGEEEKSMQSLDRYFGPSSKYVSGWSYALLRATDEESC